MPFFGTNIPAADGTGVNRRRLGRNFPIRLWAIEKKCWDRDATDSSQGVLLSMELTLKLWEFWPEIMYIYILGPSKNIHTIFKLIGTD